MPASAFSTFLTVGRSPRFGQVAMANIADQSRRRHLPEALVQYVPLGIVRSTRPFATVIPSGNGIVTSVDLDHLFVPARWPPG